MVKNTTGGNKAKRGANKDSIVNKRVRLSESSDEIYGVATKILGGGKFHVMCNDTIMRLCNIGGKFSGKHKHSNLIQNGTWVLVGLRSWETVVDKMPKCDLLECYSNFDKDKLLQTTTTFKALEEDDSDVNFDDI